MKRTLSLLCCSLYLLPLAVLARPTPKATTTIQGTFSWSGTGADGTAYKLTGPGTLTIDTGPPPIPPVNPPSLSWMSMSPSSVVAGQSATVNVVLTQKVPDGQTVTVALTSADVAVKVPATVVVSPGTDHQSANVLTTAGIAVEKLVAVTGTYNGKSASANLRVTPGSVTPPNPVPGAGITPMVLDYLLADGSPLVGLPAPSSEVRLTGLGFGAEPGRVIWQGEVIQIVSWTENEVRVRMPAYTSQGQWEFVLFRADGYWCNMQRPLDKLMPSKARQ